MCLPFFFIFFHPVSPGVVSRVGLGTTGKDQVYRIAEITKIEEYPRSYSFDNVTTRVSSPLAHPFESKVNTKYFLERTEIVCSPPREFTEADAHGVCFQLPLHRRRISKVISEHSLTPIHWRLIFSLVSVCVRVRARACAERWVDQLRFSKEAPPSLSALQEKAKKLAGLKTHIWTPEELKFKLSLEEQVFGADSCDRNVALTVDRLISTTAPVILKWSKLIWSRSSRLPSPMGVNRTSSCG